MGREQIAGAIILDTLRERIISGLYLGYWRPGDRLPSIREVADAENVDRKTAAAAYRRLQEEGLVEVRSRSGVYLRTMQVPDPPGPLERLHRQWLQNTYQGARELGLDTESMLRLIRAVSEVEGMRIPVIECNWPQAEALARELRDRLEVHAAPYLLSDLHPGDPILTDVPILVTTPYHSADLEFVMSGRHTAIEVTIAPDILRLLQRCLKSGPTAVITANRQIGTKVRRALQTCRLVGSDDPHRIIFLDDSPDVAEATHRTRHAVLWPGTPMWVDEALPRHLQRHRPSNAIADDSIAWIRMALLDAAIDRVRSDKRPNRIRVS